MYSQKRRLHSRKSRPWIVQKSDREQILTCNFCKTGVFSASTSQMCKGVFWVNHTIKIPRVAQYKIERCETIFFVCVKFQFCANLGVFFFSFVFELYRNAKGGLLELPTDVSSQSIQGGYGRMHVFKNDFFTIFYRTESKRSGRMSDTLRIFSVKF